MGGKALFARLAIVFIFLLFASWAQAEKRVALVVGNAGYQTAPALATPANDAEDMAKTLKDIGFSVILERNLSKRDMERAIGRFARLAQDADVALFYYAGHGLQYRGVNYLAPIDSRLEDEFSLSFDLTRLDDVLYALDQARGVRILILDACRDNPLLDRLSRTAMNRSYAPTRGLARIEPTRGMLIAYSTQPNQVAIDGDGRNSPFASALIKELNEPGVEVGALFRRVAAEVHRQTEGRQLPELSLSLLGELYLNTQETDLQAWARLRSSENPADIEAFMARYPTSGLVPDARQRLAVIERQPVEQVEREQKERIARESVERERVEQAERERLEKERIIREQAEQEKKSAEAAAKLKTADLAQPEGTPTESQPSRPLAGDVLIKNIKKELKRVGCYAGTIDGKWTTAGSSIKKFVLAAHISAAPDEPTIDLLNLLRGQSERVCPPDCNKGEIERGGRCVAKTCASGYERNEDGNCTKQKSRSRTASRSEEATRSTKKTAPAKIPPPPRLGADGRPCGARSCSAAMNGCFRRCRANGRTFCQHCSNEYNRCMQTGTFIGRICQHSGLARK